MRNASHKTRIGIIREHVTEWRKAEGLSREAVAIMIVEAHKASDGPARTGIAFENSGDAFTAAKTCADRIFRWLDDETKDTNFLPANFEDSILLAMPMLRRMACVDEMLRMLGLGARGLDGDADAELNINADLVEMLKEDGEAHQALANLIGASDLASLQRADKELNESIATQTKVRNHVEAAIKRVQGGIRRVTSIGKDRA